VIGVVVLTRSWVQAFTEKQVDLITTFANQAVIAIENTRLLNELRQSLERQTATSEVLGVISRSPGELDAVFEAILSNATRICEATYGNLLLWENGAFRRAAQCNAPQELIDEFQRNPVFVPLAQSFGSRPENKRNGSHGGCPGGLEFGPSCRCSHSAQRAHA